MRAHPHSFLTQFFSVFEGLRFKKSECRERVLVRTKVRECIKAEIPEVFRSESSCRV